MPRERVELPIEEPRPLKQHDDDYYKDYCGYRGDTDTSDTENGERRVNELP